MRIRLEKTAVNISKLTGSKNEKARWGFTLKTSDLHFVYKTHWMEIKITEYVICWQEVF